MVRTRTKVSFDPADPVLAWYGRAVDAMKQKPVADPTSWRYQAAIHEYGRAIDPLAQPTDVMPSSEEQATYWTQCQHGSWYFLPWHRMYVHHFEKIVAAEIERLGGPADWALPYWNYSADDQARLLPTAFRPATLPDGSSNPLHAPRDPDCNAGLQFADDRDVALANTLTEPDHNFEGVISGGSPGFGGPRTNFEHGGGNAGWLEVIPHGSMHGKVGGDDGWMGAFHTAALDPIFWLHHANIDRLWEVWLRRDPLNANPIVQRWLTSVPFPFRDKDGQAVIMRSKDVLDTTSAPLSYEYDDVGDPLAPPMREAVTPATPRRRSSMPKKRPPAEMVGATETEIELGSGTTSAVLPVARAATRATERAARTRRSGAAAPAPTRVYLNIENVVSTGRAPAYDVYVNAPEGADRRQQDEHFAGRFSMFGLVEASRPAAGHAGNGLHYALDVTSLYEKLMHEPGWDPENLRVSFRSTRDSRSRVQVGRVSLYFE